MGLSRHRPALSLTPLVDPQGGRDAAAVALATGLEEPPPARPTANPPPPVQYGGARSELTEMRLETQELREQVTALVAEMRASPGPAR
jgi:hypothetical protein